MHKCRLNKSNLFLSLVDFLNASFRGNKKRWNTIVVLFYFAFLFSFNQGKCYQATRQRYFCLDLQAIPEVNKKCYQAYA